MPNTGRGGGISRKITSAQDRKRLKEVVKDLEVPTGMGVILRTAGANRTKVEIKRDYEYLMRAWETVRNLTLQSSAPALVYEEGSLIKRSIRDLYNKDISEILVSGENGYREAKDFMRMLMPSHAKMVQPYREATPIFARSGIESHLDKMLQPQVTLKSGGYIIINQTEALVSIDVNSGRSTREHSIEDTALQTNLEAAEEVARQLRLRDLAGLIVIDFIDMEEKRNNRAVEKRLKDNLKNDRARIQVGRISHFGLLEMSRQRIRASVLESTMQVCAHCGGTGHVRSQSSVGLHVIRAIEEFLLRSAANDLIVKMPVATALYVLNQKRDSLTDLEGRFGVRIAIEADEKVGAQHLFIERGGPASGVARGPILPAYDDTVDDDPEVPDGDETEEVETDAGAVVKAERPEGPQAARAEGDPRRKRRRRRRGRNRGDEKRNGDAADGNDGQSAEAADEAGGSEIATPGGEAVNDPAVATAGSQSDETKEPAAPGKRRRRSATSKPVESDRAIAVSEEPVTEAVATEAEPVAKSEKARARRKKAVAASVPEKVAVAAEPEVQAASPVEAPKETKTRPSRRVEQAVDAPFEPKLSVSGAGNDEPAAEEKPRKGGWWQKRGFF
jgi:ribonuclease E